MHRSGRREVSLRGNSAREVPRDAFLSRIAEERAARSQGRRKAAAALLIQRVWRGRATAAAARSRLLQDWDATWQPLLTASGASVAPSSTPPNAVDISEKLLRPLVVCLRRRRRVRAQGTAGGSKPASGADSAEGVLSEDLEWRLRLGKEAEDLQRLHAALLFLVRSLDSADAALNFCSLAVASPSQAASPSGSEARVAIQQLSIWRLQSKSLLSLASSLLSGALQSPGSGSSAQLQLCALAVRASIVITDAAAWKFLLKEKAAPGTASASQAESAAVEAYSLLPALLQPRPVTFCKALGAYILEHCPVRRHSGSAKGVPDPMGGLSRDAFVLLVASVTLALRPLLAKAPQGMSAQTAGASGLKREAAAELARHLYTLPLLTWRIPETLLRTFTHQAALLPVLESLRQQPPAEAGGVMDASAGGGADRAELPSAAWALANLSMLCCAVQPNSGAPAGGGTRALDSLPLEVFVGTAIGLAQQAVAGVEHMQRQAQEGRRKGKGREGARRGEEEEEDEDEGEGEEGEEELEAGVRHLFVDPLLMRSLAPLCEQGVLGLILRSLAPPLPGPGFQTQGVTVVDLGLLYSLTLTLLLALRPSKGVPATPGPGLSPVALLNVLGFTKGVLPALWHWLSSMLQAPGSAHPSLAQGSPSASAYQKVFQARSSDATQRAGDASSKAASARGEQHPSGAAGAGWRELEPAAGVALAEGHLTGRGEGPGVARAPERPGPSGVSREGGGASSSGVVGTFWERARQGLFPATAAAAAADAPGGAPGRRRRRRGRGERGGSAAEGGTDWMELDSDVAPEWRMDAGSAIPVLPSGLGSLWALPRGQDGVDPGEGLEEGEGNPWMLRLPGAQALRSGQPPAASPEHSALEQAKAAANEAEAIMQWEVTLARDALLTQANAAAAAAGARRLRSTAASPAPSTGPVGLVLELFARVYAHLLLVLDDEEFYNVQSPFSLAEQRAIAATLNTWVYSAILAARDSSSGTASPAHPASDGSISPTLQDAAVRCLRALYDRDSRRPFCPPLLWRAPALARPLSATAAARVMRRRQQQQQEREEEPALSSAERLLREQLDTPLLRDVLRDVPHVLSFEDRVVIFRELVVKDKAEGGIAVSPGVHVQPVVDIRVRRDRLVEDGFALLASLGPKLKGRVRVTFVDAFGAEEMGIDQGGLFKEFLTDLAKAAFNPNYGLFVQTATEEGLLYPSAAAAYLEDGLPMVEFLGRIVGKALYEGILLEYPFAPLFVSKLMGRYAFLDELQHLDAELYRNLMYLKHYSGDAQDLALDFTVTEEVLGEHRSVELLPGGGAIPVTSDNKRRYIHAVADYKLNRQMGRVVSAFVAGLSDMIPPAWLTMFNPREFNQLLSGGDEDVDVADLQANTVLSGYSAQDRTVRLFWEVVGAFSREDKRELLKFVTSCSRPPLLGFKYLQPPFTLHKGVSDEDFLPSAATCVNTLKLPQYRRAGTLREKLKYAIKSRAGFDFS